MKLTISNMSGAKQGEFDLDDALLVFDKGSQSLHEYVVAYRTNQRAGTASTLSKSEVRGTGSKPWKQKGTGRARAGYRQSPIWRGGSVAFGPHPKDYSKHVNKKAAKLAFRRAFSDKVAAGAVDVLDALAVDEPKTRAFVPVLDALKIEGAALFVVDKVEHDLALASRNVPDIKIVAVDKLNAFDVVRYPRIVVCQAAMETLQKRLAGGPGKKTS